MQVSIVLTTLNAATYLRECIDSCLSQTHRDLELIVVDGGSTDATLAIVDEYADPRISVVHQAGNAGKIVGALNVGLDKARGEFLTWMQADSVYDLDAICVMVRELESNAGIGQVYADYREIDKSGNFVREIQLTAPDTFLEQRTGDPGGVCFLIRRDVRDFIGPHQIYAYPSHDFDYRMRIALHFKSLHIHRALYSWRIHNASLSAKFGWMTIARKDVEIRRHLRISNPGQIRQLNAKIDMEYAFQCYQSRDFRYVPARVLIGLRNDLRYAGNRGVWAIFVKSLVFLGTRR